MHTLEQLTRQKNLAYDHANEIQARLTERLNHAAQNTAYVLNYVEKPSNEFHRVDLGVIPWVEAQKHANALRAQGHSVTTLYGIADTSSTWDLRRELAAAFDQAADIETKIQAHHRQQKQLNNAA